MNRFINLFVISVFALLVTASSLNDARKANEAFRSGDYETAVNLYQSAISQNPDDARLYFNLGNAFSRLGMAEEAKEAFDIYRNLSDEPAGQAMADYNTGTMLSEAEQYEEAMEYFRNSLINNPADDDARYNYEMALRRLQEQQQDQQPQPQDQDQNDGDGEQDQQDDSTPPDQDQDGEDQDGGDPDMPQDQDSQDSDLPQPDQLTQEEAENILNALEQLERELLENRKKEATETTSNEKDW